MKIYQKSVITLLHLLYKMKKKKAEITIETVAIFLLALGLIVVAIFLIVRNKNVLESLLNLFRGLR